MVASNIINGPLAKKINLLCLIAAVILVLVLPFKKEIWYDESISILCSKGISHDTHLQFANTTLLSSATIQQLNNNHEVFNATVNDNANSFLYNIGLHWFTSLFGNSITIYMLFSKLCGIVALIAFYAICRLFFGNTLFTSFAILLLAIDNNFLGMSHEIRAYAMGIMFLTIAGVYFFKFIYQNEKPVYLLLTSLFSVGAILSHFLTAYIILAFLVILLYTKRAALFSFKNIAAAVLPVCLLGLFFFFAYPGLQTMSVQNQHIHERTINTGFSIWEVLLRAMKFTSINFKIVFPAFTTAIPVLFFSFILLAALYIYGLSATKDKNDKRKLNILFIPGISGTFFLTFLAFKSGHYTALYYRYFSFCLPFCSLSIAWLIYLIFKNAKVSASIKTGLLLLILLPVLILFAYGINPKAVIKYNHAAIADEIIKDNVMKIEVPEWDDAFLIQSFLPHGYKIDYVLNPTNPNFTIYKGNTTEVVPAIKDRS